MKAPRVRPRPAIVVACSMALAFGCGGGVPPTGSRAVLPETYKQREKEIMDGFKAGLKKPQAPARK